MRQITETDLRTYLASARRTLADFARVCDMHIDGGSPPDWEIHAWALQAELELLTGAVSIVLAGIDSGRHRSASLIKEVPA